jgi:hypothetical protein
VNERNLSRTLSMSVVDALKAQGHILVVKGGATALARELEELMAPRLVRIVPRIEPLAIIGGEVTSTFGSESLDDEVEALVDELTAALMDSDHVEDVFAEDNVIRRDIFRALRDGLFRAPAEGEGAVEEQVHIRLDTLGYVAATVSKLATVAAMREALGRAAELVQAHFTAYSADDRAATFLLEDGDPDGRLELEEAIADELTDLVEAGIVDLPTIDRTIDLGRPLSPAEHRSLAPRIDAAGQNTILRGGCIASWEMADARTLAVSFTPLSDQDARDVDALIGAFAREARAIVGERSSTPAAVPAAAPSPAKIARPAKAAVALPEPEPEEADDEDAEEEAPPPKKARPAAKTAATKTAAAKKSLAAKAAPAKAEPASKTAKKVAAKKSPAAKVAPAGKVAAKPAAKSTKAPAKKR